jgi:hypothetical protein
VRNHRIWNLKVKARTQDTNLDRFGPPVQYNALHPVWGIVYCALRLDVELPIGCSADIGTPALLYISQGWVTSRLQGRSPSRITEES